MEKVSHSWERVQCCLNCPKWQKTLSDEFMGVCWATNRLTFRSDVCSQYDGNEQLLTNRWGRILNV